MSTTLRASSSPAAIVDGEFFFAEKDFDRIAALLRDTSGIYLPRAKATLVYSRLAKRLRKLQFKSFADYCDFVASPEGEEEAIQMLAALTTNVTSFFREPHHFDHLRDRVLAPMHAKIKAGGRLRLWSSACSTGQEAYSIALTVLSVWPEANTLDIRILATDIDPNVVATAREGNYSAEAIAPIPAAQRDRWLKKAPGEFGEERWAVRPDLAKLISFKQLNLIGDWPMRGKFDAIFCRNVVIYFEEETQNRIWGRFRDYLAPEGRLYIGHSERVDSTDFATDGLTVYRLNKGGRTP